MCDKKPPSHAGMPEKAANPSEPLKKDSAGNRMPALEQRYESTRDSQRFYQTVYESAAEGIAVLEAASLRFRHANPTMCDMLGCAPQELSGARLTDMIPPGISSRLQSLLDAKEQVESHFSANVPCRRSDGRVIYADINSAGMVIGGESCIVSFFTDVTQRHEAESILRESEEKHRKLLETVPNIIYRLDIEGRFTYVSSFVEKMLGFTPSELIGHHFSRIVHPDDLSSVSRQDVLREYLGKVNTEQSGLPQPKLFDERRTHPRQTKELRVRLIPKGWKRDEGSECVVGELWSYGEVSASGYYQDRQFLGTVGVIQDITVRSRLQEAIQKQDKLEAIGRLAGGVAHDFNNLLTPVLISISMAKNEDDHSTRRDVLDDAERGVQRMQNLINQLLTFSKEGSIVTKTATIPELLEGTTRFVLSGSASIPRFNISPDIWPVNIDTSQIGQVIQNIVINASHAMPDGGVITISAENYTSLKKERPLFREGYFVKLEISDTGTGIPKELLPRIFEPYFTTKREGHGIGLASSYSIVKRHMGEITVESSEKGTTFTVYLPAVPDSAVSSEPIRRAIEPIRGHGLVLLMDDDEAIRSSGNGMLTSLGYRCVCAQNGESALRTFEEARKEGNPFAVTILDVTVPGGMGAHETAKRIRGIDPSAKIIVSSGYTTSDIIANPEAHGFNGVLRKPYGLVEASFVIYKVLKGKGSR